MVCCSRLLAAVCLGAAVASATVEALAPVPRGAFVYRSASGISQRAFSGGLCVGGLEGNRTRVPEQPPLVEGRACQATRGKGRPVALLRSIGHCTKTAAAVAPPLALALRAAGLRLGTLAAVVRVLAEGGMLLAVVSIFALLKSKLPEAGRLPRPGRAAERGEKSRQAHPRSPTPELRLEASPPPVQELKRGLFLDVDCMSIYGQDGNDLAIGFQHSRKSFEELTALYERLCNSKVADLVDTVRAEGIEDDVRVCLFTRRATLLQYRSARTFETSHITYSDEWQHSATQVCIPGDVTTSDEILRACRAGPALDEWGVLDLRCSWDRLLAARVAIARFLKLGYVPDVVVTAANKDVVGTAARLGLDPERAVLWDDNQELSGDPHVQVVEKYEGMPLGQKEELLSFLEATNPARELPQDTIDFMLSAKPEARSIEYRDDNSVAYKINEEDAAARPSGGWALPSFFLAPSSASTPTPTPAGASSPAPSDAEHEFRREYA